MGPGGDEKLVSKEWHQCGKCKNYENRCEDEQSAGKVTWTGKYVGQLEKDWRPTVGSSFEFDRMYNSSNLLSVYSHCERNFITIRVSLRNKKKVLFIK